MKHLLGIEIAVLVILVLAAIFIRLDADKPDDTTVKDPQQTTQAPITTAPPETTEVFAPQTTAPTETEVPTTPTWLIPEPDRDLSAQQYFVYDCDTDTFLVLSGKEDDQVEPASITKIFTAYVAMQYLEPTEEIKITDALDLVAAGSSTARLDWGDVLTAEMLIEAMLLPSGNDAAYALAVAIGREIDEKPRENASVAAQTFMKEMNRQAKELGMTGTNFVNPDGIHRTNHYSTLKDLAIMGELALENETIMKYASTCEDKVTLSSGEVLEWENTNALIHPESEYYCPYAVGLKTGQTPYAGSCLLSAFQYEGRELIIGVFGCAETNDRFVDTLQLFNAAISVETQTGETE